MEYFHKDLCHLLSRNLSNKTIAAAVEAAKAAAEAGAVVVAAASPTLSEEVAMRNDTFPVSLLFRANLFKDGFMLPRRVSCLKLISNNEDLGFYAFPLRNLNWNTDSLRFYAEKQAITWPTCTQAFNARSTFALLWARMNRCSCIYDIRAFPKLSQMEKQTLSWLQKEVRPRLHREAKFERNVDTPIALLDGPGLPSYANGNCLWNAFVTRKERTLPTPITMFAIDEYVLKTLIKQPAEFDSYDIPKKRKGNLLHLHDHFQPESSQSVLNDNKWECDKNLREKGVDPLTNTETGICLANIPTYSSFNVRIALTIFGQGTSTK